VLSVGVSNVQQYLLLHAFEKIRQTPIQELRTAERNPEDYSRRS